MKSKLMLLCFGHKVSHQKAYMFKAWLYAGNWTWERWRTQWIYHWWIHNWIDYWFVDQIEGNGWLGSWLNGVSSQALPLSVSSPPWGESLYHTAPYYILPHPPRVMKLAWLMCLWTKAVSQSKPLLPLHCFLRFFFSEKWLMQLH